MNQRAEIVLGVALLAITGPLAGCTSSAKTFHLEGEKKFDYSTIYLVKPKEDPLDMVPMVTKRIGDLGYRVIVVEHGQTPEGGEGSGFVVTADGFVMTCDHVVAEANGARVWIGETRYDTEVVVRDKERDLALLRIVDPLPAPLQPVSFRTADITLGEQVFAMGYPISHLLGKSLHITQGLISAKAGLQGNADQLQISAGIQPGNSGGPVLDNSGMLAAVVQQTINPWSVAERTGGALPQNVNFGIKAAVILNFLRERQPEVHARLVYDRTTPLSAAEHSVVRIRSGLVSRQLENARKAVVFLQYESFRDIWLRFRYFVLSFFDFESHQLLFRAGQLGDNMLSNHTVVIDDTFNEIKRVMGPAAKPEEAPPGR